MAQEILVNTKIQLSNGALEDGGPDLGTQRLNQASALLWENVVQLVANTDTQITGAGGIVTNIPTQGICYMINLDGTNYVQWGPDNAGAIVVLGRMLPFSLVNGAKVYDIAPSFRLDSGTKLRLKANTGACNVRVCVYNA